MPMSYSFESFRVGRCFRCLWSEVLVGVLSSQSLCLLSRRPDVELERRVVDGGRDGLDATLFVFHRQHQPTRDIPPRGNST